MDSFKTEKGTVLPILKLKGKDYLEVKWRVVWFREDHPNWSIETEFVQLGPDFAIAKATIRDETSRIICTGQKHENKAGFADFHEKAESGSIGRALGFLGYGTQFCADDLDEGKRVVDSPVERPKSQASQKPASSKPIPDVFIDVDLGEYVCKVGRKYNQVKLKDIGDGDIKKYLHWLTNSADDKNKSFTGLWKEFVDNAEAYLKSKEIGNEPMPA